MIDSAIAVLVSGGFNTGRPYSDQGQRIWWMQREDGWLHFIDRDRGISGWILRFGPRAVLEEDILPAWLMRKYDHGFYRLEHPFEPDADIPVPDDVDYGPMI